MTETNTNRAGSVPKFGQPALSSDIFCQVWVLFFALVLKLINYYLIAIVIFFLNLFSERDVNVKWALMG